MLAKYEQFFILLGRKIDLLHTFSPKLCVVGLFFFTGFNNKKYS